MANRTLSATLAGLILALVLGPAAALADVPTQACYESSDRLATLTLRPADRAAIEQSIRWTDRAPAAAHALVEAHELSGECAGVVSGFVMGVGALGGGESFAIKSNTLVRAEKPAWPLIEDDPVEGEPPILPGGWFVMAVLVNGNGGAQGTSDYLGLWQSGDGAVVATFRRTAGRADGRIEPLFRSTLPLTSIAYFPAIDVQAGRIGLVQEVGGARRLIGYDWQHPEIR